MGGAGLSDLVERLRLGCTCTPEDELQRIQCDKCEAADALEAAQAEIIELHEAMAKIILGVALPLEEK